MLCQLIEEHRRQQEHLSVMRACQVLELPRCEYYRWRSTHTSGIDSRLDDTAVRDHLQRIALMHPCYGYRRISHQLRREGVVVNHKRVLRLLRQDNLLCLRRRPFVRTTDSRHGLPVYPNLAANCRLERINQLWVADLTYIRLGHAFVYLAVILDAYSRRVIGWALENHLRAELAVCALRMAVADRPPPEGMLQHDGLIHHSDRGVQYASGEYTDLLRSQGITISMSRRGNPYDNAKAESFMKTLKYEEVYLQDYDTIADARASISMFLTDVYNQQRLHSALGYCPPAEFEASLTTPMIA